MIGREKERKTLLAALERDESQFVAVYGRRRVGKTYLIRETFGYQFAFQHTGLQNGNKAAQLKEFQRSLKNAGMKNIPRLSDWSDAFFALWEFLKTHLGLSARLSKTTADCTTVSHGRFPSSHSRCTNVNCLQNPRISA